MPHYYPVVIPGGKSLAGDSLGFHAYSLRIDNLTNQWLLEETSLAWIPPYSLGVCLRLYGTGVGIILNQAPIGQPQLTPVTGEQAVGVYSDQMRTEVAGSPVRQYSLVQSVSDLTQGPQPALPPVGVDRLWADTSGNIHHIHSNGQDLTLLDPSNIYTLVPLGGDLFGQINSGHIGIQNNSLIYYYDTGGTQRRLYLNGNDNNNYLFAGQSGRLQIYSDFGTAGAGALAIFDNNIPRIHFLRYIQVDAGGPAGNIYFGSTAAGYINFDGANWSIVPNGVYAASFNASSSMATPSLTVNNNPMNGAYAAGSVSVSQGVACSTSTQWCRWVQLGRVVHVDCYIGFTATAGTSGQVIVAQLGGGIPVPAQGNSYSARGTFFYLHSGAAFYTGTATIGPTLQVNFMTNAQGNFLGATPAFQASINDAVSFSLTYET